MVDAAATHRPRKNWKGFFRIISMTLGDGTRRYRAQAFVDGSWVSKWAVEDYVLVESRNSTKFFLFNTVEEARDLIEHSFSELAVTAVVLEE